MVVVSSLQTNLHSIASQYRHHLCKRSPASLLYSSNQSTKRPAKLNGVLHVKAYIEDSATVSGFVNKVIGALPVIGLLARIVSDEGGVGGDTIDFAEFRRRVGKKCSGSDADAFCEFQQRRGRSGDPLYVLLCCWLAAVGAGLLKSEEILEGVARLRVSNDIEFEEETFLAMMNEARERRAKTRAPLPTIPMELRVEKALEAIYVCCYGTGSIEEYDERLISIMLNAIFPTVGQVTIQNIVKDTIQKLEERSEEFKFPEPKELSKEAVQMQMKDLQFLKKGNPE